MPAAYTNLDEANARIDALEAELAATIQTNDHLTSENGHLQREVVELGNAARFAQKAAEKARAEVMELKMTANVDPGMVRGSVNRGTYASPAGGL